MIAPLRQTEDSSRLRRLRRAHRVVATTLLKKSRHPADTAASVSAWRAWLLTAWIALVITIYAAAMLNAF